MPQVMESVEVEVVPASAFVGRKPFSSPVQPLLFHVYFWSPQTRVVKLASTFSVSFVVAMGSCTPHPPAPLQR